jgi:hypothetical protein
MVLSASELVRPGVGNALTAIVIAFEVAGVTDGHERDDVICTVTTSLFESVVVVNALLFVPAFTPFTLH